MSQPAPGTHLNTATKGFSLSPPAERGERVGERGTNAMAAKGRRLPGVAASSPHPSPPKEEREIDSSAGGSVKMHPRSCQGQPPPDGISIAGVVWTASPPSRLSTLTGLAQTAPDPECAP
jgi:hypothetical protein